LLTDYKIMAYALYDFFKSKTVEAGKTDLINWADGDEKPTDLLENRNVRVSWVTPKSGTRKNRGSAQTKIYQARILRLSGRHFPASL